MGFQGAHEAAGGADVEQQNAPDKATIVVEDEDSTVRRGTALSACFEIFIAGWLQFGVTWG